MSWYYRFVGEAGLEDRRINEHRRDQGLLAKAEGRNVQNWIKDKCSDQMKRPFALWTAQAVRELFRKKLGRELGLGRRVKK